MIQQFGQRFYGRLTRKGIAVLLAFWLNLALLPCALAMILGTLPLALVGGLWLLYLLGYDLSVAAGVAVEIGVVLLVYLNQSIQNQIAAARKAGRKLEPADIRQAVIDGAVMRVRPELN